MLVFTRIYFKELILFEGVKGMTGRKRAALTRQMNSSGSKYANVVSGQLIWASDYVSGECVLVTLHSV
jgi:hypothetical protein